MDCTLNDTELKKGLIKILSLAISISKVTNILYVLILYLFCVIKHDVSLLGKSIVIVN